MRRLLAVGVAASVAGLAFAFVPSLAGGLTPTYDVVVGVGVLAVVLGVHVSRGRLAADRERAEPLEPETRTALPTPGDGFDRRLAAVGPGRSREGDEDRAAVRERLEAAALNVLANEGRSPEDARASLETGEWTDDPTAAAFFAGGDLEASTGERVRRSLSGESEFERRARRAALAVAARAERPKERDRE